MQFSRTPCLNPDNIKFDWEEDQTRANTIILDKNLEWIIKGSYFNMQGRKIETYES